MTYAEVGAQADNEIKTLRGSLDQSNTALSERNVQNADLRDRLQLAQAEISRINAVLSSSAGQISELTAKLTALQSTYNALMIEYTDYKLANPPKSTEPIGTGLVSITKLNGASYTERVGKSNGYGVTFPEGVFDEIDMNRPGAYPVYGFFLNSPPKILGSGKDKTILRLKKGSLTQGYKKISSIVEPGTNPYYLMRTDKARLLQDFTLQGTDQGTDPITGKQFSYNGLVMYETIDSTIKNVRIVDIPGSAAVPPNESFPLSLYKGKGTWLVDNVEIVGNGVSSNGLSWTSADPGLKISLFNFSVIGAPHSAAATAFNQVINSYYAYRPKCDGSMVQFNFEQVSVNGGSGVNNVPGSGIVIVEPDVRNPNPLKKFNGQYSHLSIEASQAGVSNRVDIYDPVGISAENPYGVTISKEYGYATVTKTAQKRKGSDIHLWVKGVERPDLIKWHRTKGAA